MDSLANLASNFPAPDKPVESPEVRKLVNFILNSKNSHQFESQNFFDSSKSVEVVSIIGDKVYTIYCYENVYLSISARPFRKKFSPLERFACADENFDGNPDFGFIGDSTTSKKDAKYFAISNMFAWSDETMVMDNQDYWQKVYDTSLKEIIKHYKL